jgi:hypothetical protein
MNIVNAYNSFNNFNDKCKSALGLGTLASLLLLGITLSNYEKGKCDDETAELVTDCTVSIAEGYEKVANDKSPINKLMKQVDSIKKTFRGNA